MFGPVFPHRAFSFAYALEALSFTSTLFRHFWHRFLSSHHQLAFGHGLKCGNALIASSNASFVSYPAACGVGRR
jgi:hypothetical protein